MEHTILLKLIHISQLLRRFTSNYLIRVFCIYCWRVNLWKRSKTKSTGTVGSIKGDTPNISEGEQGGQGMYGEEMAYTWLMLFITPVGTIVYPNTIMYMDQDSKGSSSFFPCLFVHWPVFRVEIDMRGSGRITEWIVTLTSARSMPVSVPIRPC